MMPLPEYFGTVFIKDGKIEQVDIKLDREKPLMDIEQIMALKNMIDRHIIDYEKNIKRT